MDTFEPGKVFANDKNKVIEETVEDRTMIVQTEEDIKELDDSFAAEGGTGPIDLSNICNILDRRVNWSAVELFYHSQTYVRYDMVDGHPVKKYLFIRMAHPAINTRNGQMPRLNSHERNSMYSTMFLPNYMLSPEISHGFDQPLTLVVYEYTDKPEKGKTVPLYSVTPINWG